jgi:hypothetical protein
MSGASVDGVFYGYVSGPSVSMVLAFKPDGDDIVATGGGQVERIVGGSSSRLVGMLVGLLPVSDRARYDEEFRAELFELRAEPRWRHVTYAVRQLVRAVWLRRELRRPRREREW